MQVILGIYKDNLHDACFFEFPNEFIDICHFSAPDSGRWFCHFQSLNLRREVNTEILGLQGLDRFLLRFHDVGQRSITRLCGI